jgi:hypothetical protein
MASEAAHEYRKPAWPAGAEGDAGIAAVKALVAAP